MIATVSATVSTVLAAVTLAALVTAAVAATWPSGELRDLVAARRRLAAIGRAVKGAHRSRQTVTSHRTGARS